MRQKSPQLRMPCVTAAFAVLLLALCVLACPTKALARTPIAHSVDASGNVTDYYTPDDVEKKGPKADVVVMDADWHLDKALAVADKTKLTIDMQGHKVDCKYTCFWVVGGGELVLTSSTEPVAITYTGYSAETGDTMKVTTVTGGLITATSSESGGAFSLGEKAKLTLDGVTAGGSIAGDGSGGVTLDENSILTLKNGAKIEHNRGTAGAGVYCIDNRVTINLDNASISDNYCTGLGGGIYAKYSNITINMTNGAKIANNSAKAGGGIYFNMSGFNVLSSDGNAFISGNTARESSRTTSKSNQSGGGVHVNSTSGKHDGLIEGITISGNYSAYDGGGLELDQQNTTLRNCKIVDNWCKYEGGGIYVCNDGNLIEGCTITGNACSVDSGGNYEGGGVFVWHSYDVKVSGVCVIKGNTRGEGTDNADDVMLRENAGGTAKAYITGNLAKGSTVGVRTGYTSDRRIAKNFSSETKDGLFYDLGGYYVSYGSDEGGDAWQRHVNKEFALKVNGEVKARYRWKDSVGQVVPAFKGDDEVFWYWDDDATTGLNPISFYLNDDVRYLNALVISMPQNDVDAAAVYATRVKQVLVSVEAPEAGKELPKTAQVSRADEGKGAKGSFRSAVTWYEVGEDDKASSTASTGVAKAGTAYVASVICTESYEHGLHFSKSLLAGDVTVRTPSGGDGPEAESASVDGATGALTVVTKAFAETDGEKTDTKDGKATVKMVDGGLEAGLGGGSAEAAALSDGAAAQSGDRAGLGEFDVSWTEGDADVVIIAPAKAGYNFCNWEGAQDGWERDDVLGTVTVPCDEVGRIDELVAVYTPVVTSAAVGLDAPEAGKPLAATASDVKVTCSDADGTEVSFAELLDVDGFRVTWSPEGGTAGYSAAYTALVELVGGAEGLVDVEKVVAAGAAVSCNGTEATAAGFTVVDGKLCLALSFGETRAVRPASVDQPEAVEVSFEEAAAGNWQLPKIVLVTLENGEAVDADVEWEAVEGFDASATAAQELQVKGTITHIAYDGELGDSALSRDVTVTVKVAAPEQQTTDETTTKTETTTSTKKKGTPSTGDTTRSSFAALLILSTACLAAARFLYRNN